jgi:UV DNA damage endonuclease
VHVFDNVNKKRSYRVTLRIIDASEVVSGRKIVKDKIDKISDRENINISDFSDVSNNIREKIYDTMKNVGIEKVMSAHRIGYACVNMSIGANTSVGAVTNRTCRLDSCNDKRLRELISGNLDGMRKIIEWNIKKGIRLYRISSMVIPFASHDINKIAWWDEYESVINGIGEIIRNSGMRVSMHPGQYVNINSPNMDVVNFSIKELDYHAKFMDMLGLDNTHRIILHIGGAYGDKVMSMKRFVDVYGTLSENIKSRLIIENDDKIYNVRDLLNVSLRTGIPVVLDVLHHQVNNSGQEKDKDIKSIFEQCFSTWSVGTGVPKIHFSTQRPDAKYGVHADEVDINLLMEIYCEFINYDFDIMLETKNKEISVLRAMKVLGDAKKFIGQ